MRWARGGISRGRFNVPSLTRFISRLASAWFKPCLRPSAYCWPGDRHRRLIARQIPSLLLNLATSAGFLPAAKKNYCTRKKAGLGALVIWTPMNGTALLTVTQMPEVRLVVICT